MPFATLGLIPALAHAAAEQGYLQTTPVQALAIPAAIAGRDLRACAPTGSGKTAAFALALLQQIAQSPRSEPRRAAAMVLLPTRELAVQVGAVIAALAQHIEPVIKVSTVFGGVSINPQMMA